MLENTIEILQKRYDSLYSRNRTGEEQEEMHYLANAIKLAKIHNSNRKRDIEIERAQSYLLNIGISIDFSLGDEGRIYIAHKGNVILDIE